MRSRGKSGGQPLSPAQRLGAAVRARRRSLRLDQSELAALAGVGLAFLYELEHGKPTVRLDKVLDVLDVLGLRFCLEEGKDRLQVSASLRDAPS